MSQEDQVAKCPECGGPLRPYHEGPLRGHRLKWQRCDYCGYYVKPDLFDRALDEVKQVHDYIGNLATLGVGLTFIGVFSLVIMAVLGSFSSIRSIWPNSNVSTITTQVSQGLAAGSTFLSILVSLIIAGVLLLIVGFAHHSLTLDHKRQPPELSPEEEEREHEWRDERPEL